MYLSLIITYLMDCQSRPTAAFQTVCQRPNDNTSVSPSASRSNIQCTPDTPAQLSETEDADLDSIGRPSAFPIPKMAEIAVFGLRPTDS